MKKTAITRLKHPETGMELAYDLDGSMKEWQKVDVVILQASWRKPKDKSSMIVGTMRVTCENCKYNWMTGTGYLYHELFYCNKCFHVFNEKTKQTWSLDKWQRILCKSGIMRRKEILP